MDPGPPAVLSEESTEEPATTTEEEPTDREPLGYDWRWTASKLTMAMDLGANFVIDRAGRVPLEAGDDEREELERVVARYGETKIGQIEAPLWVVLLVALVMFFVSKWWGAEKKETQQIPTTTTRPPADTAATKTPAPVPDATTEETPHPPSPPPEDIAGSGSALGVMSGF